MQKLEEILIITKEDLERGERYYRYEQVRPINRENIYLSLIYAILNQMEHFSGANLRFNKMMDYKLMAPELVLANKKKLKNILNIWENKYEGLINLSRWFSKSKIDLEIINDISDSRVNEINIRNKIAEEAPRIAYKSASLVLMKLGYNQIVPLDIHAKEFLDAYLRKNKKMSKKWRFLTETSGLDKYQYPPTEELFRNISGEYNVNPAILQSAIYIRDSKESNYLKKFKE